MNVSYRRDALLNEKVRELTHMSQAYWKELSDNTKKLIYIYMFYNSIECHVTANTIYHSECVRKKNEFIEMHVLEQRRNLSRGGRARQCIQMQFGKN